MLSRRAFLQSLAATAAGVYVPTKTIFLPPRGGWPVFADFEVFGPDYSTKDPLGTVAVPQDADDRLTEKMLQELLSEVWMKGGEPSIIHCSERVLNMLTENEDTPTVQVTPDHWPRVADVYVSALGSHHLIRKP